MEIIKRHKILVVIIGIIVAVFLVTGIIFFTSHSTCIKYNDWWVIGKTFNEVQERYGEFDIELGKRKKGYFIKKDNSAIMPSGLPIYYWMRADENNVIYDVYIDVSPGG